MARKTISQVLRINLITGVVFASLLLVTNLCTLVDILTKSTAYSNDADAIADDLEVGGSNFEIDSEWFEILSAEYDALSDFDKTNVYCDVDALQADPDSQLDDSELDMMAGMCLTMLSFVCFGYVVFMSSCCGQKCERICGIQYDDKDDTTANPNDLYARARRENGGAFVIPKPTVAEQNLDNFRSNTAFLFIVVGPFIALTWLGIGRRSNVTGLDCHATFFSCGNSGGCDIEDFLLTVPLNSSLFKLVISYPLMAPGFFLGLLTLVFILVSGIVLAIGVPDKWYLSVPAFYFAYGLVPFTWVYFLDEIVPVGGGLCVLVFTLLPPLVFMVYSLVSCCLSCRGMRT